MNPTGWLTHNGARLALHDSGGTGPILLFQHGLCGDATQTAEAVPPGLRRLTLECRGHGASPFAGPISIASFADDIAALLETLGKPVPVGGISMGAAIATRLAVTRPDLVSALILVRPAWVTEPAPANMAPNAELGALLARLSGPAAKAAFLASPTATRLAGQSPDNLASLLGFCDRAPQSATAALLCAISADGPGVSASALGAIAVPALICGTSSDAIHPWSHAKQLATLIPQARLVALPAKGHDKPAHLAALHTALTDFLKEI